MSENYLGIITENYHRELSHSITLHDYHMEKLRLIGILAYPKIFNNNMSEYAFV